MKDQFLTLAGLTEGYYMERGSKFTAYASPVASEDEFAEFLQSVKKDHPKARHFCTALRLFPDASLERSSDDGEPSGSAGKPILGQLIKHDLTNVCVVVVRYFGGSKLGIPGLIEAYKTSTSNSIEAGQIIEQSTYAKVQLWMAYNNFPPFLNFCKQNEIPVFEEVFTDKASLIIGFLKTTALTSLEERLRQYTGMDFDTLEVYLAHLDMTMKLMDEEIIY